ncbi:MAG: tetratricopeptide repeat protein [bacterium]|nr:tetratricopeptide repeat protein [bacterium]
MAMKKMLFAMSVCALCAAVTPLPSQANWLDDLNRISNTLEEHNRQAEAKRQELENLNERGMDAYKAKDYDSAITYWSQAAQQRYAPSQYNLGYCFRYGIGVQADAQQAVQFYKAAAKGGSASAQAELGECYLNGIGTKKDHSEAFKWLSKAAKQKCEAAYANLGLCYYKGYGTKVSYENAVKYLRLAADNDKNAQFTLAQVYLDKNNPQHSQAEGMVWLSKASDSGSYDAKMLLAKHCLLYNKDPYPASKAILLYNDAIQTGQTNDHQSIKAQICLSLCCFSGSGMPQEIEAGVDLLSIAAVKGNSYALELLQALAEAGVIDAQELLKKASQTAAAPSDEDLDLYDEIMAICAQTSNTSLTPGEFIRKCLPDKESALAAVPQEVQNYRDFGRLATAAELGSAEAQTALGLLYASDKEINPKRNSANKWNYAYKWFNRAAQQNNTAAQTQLGICYLEGRGVEQDLEKAVALLRGSAAEGDALAKHHLGQCYARGTGVAQNTQEAQKLLSQAAGKGNTDSKEALSAMTKEQGMIFIPAGVYSDTKRYDSLKPYDAFTKGRQACLEGNAEGYALLDSSARRGCNHAKLCLAYGFLPHGHQLSNGFPTFNLEGKNWGGSERLQRYLKWMTSAADNGSLEACKSLGKAYKGGSGIAKDPAKAFSYTKAAAQQKDPAAMYGLGVCYAQGIGCQKDRAAAVKWIKHSAHAGNAEARQWIEDRRGHKLEIKDKYALGEGEVKFGDNLDEIKAHHARKKLGNYIAGSLIKDFQNDLATQRGITGKYILATSPIGYIDEDDFKYNYTVHTKSLGNSSSKVTVIGRGLTNTVSEYYLENNRTVRIVERETCKSSSSGYYTEQYENNITAVHGRPTVRKVSGTPDSRNYSAYMEWHKDGVHIILKTSRTGLGKHTIMAEAKTNTYQGPKIGGWEDLLK